VHDNISITASKSDPVYTIQPVIKPVEQPVEQPAASCTQTFNRLFNRSFNRFDNRLHRVNGVSQKRVSGAGRRLFVVAGIKETSFRLSFEGVQR